MTQLWEFLRANGLTVGLGSVLLVLVWRYRGTLRSWVRSVATWVKYGTRLDTLEARVAKLEKTSPPWPEDLRIVDGVWFGKIADEEHAFCPVCMSIERIVPLITEEAPPDEYNRYGIIKFWCSVCQLHRSRSKKGPSGVES